MFDPFKLDDEDYKILITPNTEKLCLQFINSIPTQHQIPDDELVQTPINLSAFLTPQIFSVNPFSIELAADSQQLYVQNKIEVPNNAQSFNVNNSQLTQNFTLLDHDYTSDKKRKLSYTPDDSTWDSTFCESITSANSIVGKST